MTLRVNVGEPKATSLALVEDFWDKVRTQIEDRYNVL
jgi:hypothetical protein